jgi:type IV pilus assembly protein PilQ
LSNAQEFKKKSLVSFNVIDIPVRSALQTIADSQQLNLVMSENVTGTISLNLTDVDWQQALQIILDLCGLQEKIVGNILLINTLQESEGQLTTKLETQNKLNEFEPLLSEFIQINYAKAADIAKLIKTGTDSILTSRGQVTVDTRTNTLLIRDTVKGLDTLKSAIETLDIPVKQVLIEARMVTVRDNMDEQLGIRWGMSGSSADNDTQNVYSGTLNGIEQIQDGSSEQSFVDRLNVNLPVASPAGSLALQLAKLSDGSLLDLELSVLERENKGEIVASPRILASNQNMSRIEQGTEIPYVQTAAHGATSVAFKKAVLSLEVTPQITPDNNVILELNITQDARGDIVSTSTGPAVAIDTQQIRTKVSVKNGETIVLGGIYQQQVIESVTKVPWLGDIPYLGRLFRTDSKFTEKRELLIFVTPQIVNDI